MASPSKDLDLSDAGLINDVEDTMMDMINGGFHGGSEYLTNLVDKPQYFEKENPDNSNMDDVPAMFCWVDGISLNQSGLGGQSQERQRNTFDLIGNYAYLINQGDQSDTEKMKQTGWWLLFWICQNMDLRGKVSGNPEIGDLIISKKWSLMGGQMKVLTSLQIQVSYPFTMSLRTASNSLDKYRKG